MNVPQVPIPLVHVLQPRAIAQIALPVPIAILVPLLQFHAHLEATTQMKTWKGLDQVLVQVLLNVWHAQQGPNVQRDQLQHRTVAKVTTPQLDSSTVRFALQDTNVTGITSHLIM